MCVYVSVCGCVHVSVGAQGRSHVSDPLKLELQEGAGTRRPHHTVHVLHYQAISPALLLAL